MDPTVPLNLVVCDCAEYEQTHERQYDLLPHSHVGLDTDGPISVPSCCKQVSMTGAATTKHEKVTVLTLLG